MKTIFKYDLLMGRTRLNMPKGAQVLDVQVQHGKTCLWALVDAEAEKSERVFDIYGTGHELPDNPGAYVGTFQMQGGIFIFHVFEEAV